MNHLPQWNRLSQGATKELARFKPQWKSFFMDKENSQSFEMKTKNKKITLA